MRNVGFVKGVLTIKREVLNSEKKECFFLLFSYNELVIL